MNSYLELPHGLIQSAQVAVVFGCLHVELPKGFFSQLERGEVQVMSLLEQPLLCLLVVTVYGNLLQDKCWGQETGAVTVPTPRDPRHVGTQLTRLGVCHKLLPHCWVKLPTLLRFYNFIPPLKLIWLRFFFVFYKYKHQGLQTPPSKKNKQPKQPDEHIQIIQTTKRTTFNSLWRGQKEMVFWENVSDNANSTFSMESDRVEIKKFRMCLCTPAVNW